MNNNSLIDQNGKKIVMEYAKEITYPSVEPNRYAVTEYGGIYDIKNDFREISQFKSNGEYRRVSLHLDNDQAKTKAKFGVHRLVAHEFCQKNKNIDLVIDHIDCNPSNNYYKNLEWVTNPENIRRAYNNKLRKINSYKSEDQIKKLCELLANTKLAYKDAVSEAGIKNISKPAAENLCNDLVRNRYWKDITKNYNFDKRIQETNVENHGQKYTKEQIGELCKVLQDTDLNYKDCCEKIGLYGLNKEQINHLCSSLVSKRRYKNISEKFDFSDRKEINKNRRHY